MPAAGARALLSATRPHSFLRLASSDETRCRLRDIRTFRASSANLSPPDDANAEPGRGRSPSKTIAFDSSSTQGDDTPESRDVAQNGDMHKEALRKLGYGSARARASRAEKKTEELPPVKLPSWFMDGDVSLIESRPMAPAHSSLATVPWSWRQSQEKIPEPGSFLTSTINSVFPGRDEIENVISSTGNPSLSIELDENGPKLMLTQEKKPLSPELDTLLFRYQAGHDLSVFQVKSIVDADEALHGWKPVLDELVSKSSFDERGSIKGQGSVTGARFSMPNLRAEQGPSGPELYVSPFARRFPGPDYDACLELLATAQSELAAVASSTQLKRAYDRPVTLLSVLNYQGNSIARQTMEDLATELKADIVHLDASIISRIVGAYLGEVPYRQKGSVSLLGYAAAKMNGRLLEWAKSEPIDLDRNADPIGVVLAHVGSMEDLVAKRPSKIDSGFRYGRWEELKVDQALTALVGAADVKRQMRYPSTRRKPLIIHIHDYVELSSLFEDILKEIHEIVHRMRLDGRAVIVVGSTSSQFDQFPEWKDRVVEMSKDTCHVIPLHSMELPAFRKMLGEMDMVQANLNNITAMLEALHPTPWEEISCKFDSLTRDMQWTTDATVGLRGGVYDVQWVYRIVSIMLGNEPSGTTEYDDFHLTKALTRAQRTDRAWAELYKSSGPPYFSPLFNAKQEPTTTRSNIESSNNYNTYEKKLLTGLIDAKDIRTTFNDIVCPESTKESLIALTSLSLMRPEAFSYGVLKSERIPGALLYGPPGTGKTLLAKAVAAQSGANMLEVSGASIYDKYVGESEKNVRAVFSLARKLAPAVVFLDEADALLGSRDAGGTHSSRREVITQFLREWDGLTEMKAFIMVATNRPYDLDEAVLRRLPRRLLVDLPLRAEREAILRIVLRDEQLDGDADALLGQLADQTDQYSGSDLKNLCVSAAMQAVRDEVRAQRAHAGPGNFVLKDRRVLTRAHFDRALEDISSSISEDMDSLKAIRKFDAKYGDANARRKKKGIMGFGTGGRLLGTEEAMVRNPAAAAQ